MHRATLRTVVRTLLRNSCDPCYGSKHIRREIHRWIHRHIGVGRSRGGLWRRHHKQLRRTERHRAAGIIVDTLPTSLPERKIVLERSRRFIEWMICLSISMDEVSRTYWKCTISGDTTIVAEVLDDAIVRDRVSISQPPMARLQLDLAGTAKVQ